MKYTILTISLLALASWCLAQQDETEKKRLSVQDINEHAHVWLTDYVSELKEQETTLLANYLYINYHYLTSEINIRLQSYIAQNQLTSIILCNSDDYTKILETVRQSLDDIKNRHLPYTGQTNFLARNFQKHLEMSTSTNLKNVITGYENYIQAALDQFITQEKETIDSFIKNYTQSVQESQKAMDEISSLLSVIMEGKNPHVKEGQNKTIADLNFSVYLADNALRIQKKMNDASIKIKGLSLDVLNTSKAIYGTFYNALYAYLKEMDMIPTSLVYNQEKDSFEKGEALAALPL